MVISVPGHRFNLAQWSTEPPSFPLLYSCWWLLSDYEYSWLPACVSLYSVHSLRQLAISYLILSYLPLLYCVLPETLAHCWFGAYKIPTDVDPSVFTSRARPCSVVSNMAPGRPALDLDAFWFLSPRLYWEDPIQLIMIGNINTFIIDVWIVEVTNG